MKGLSTPLWALSWRPCAGLELGFGSQLVISAGAFLVGCGLWGYWRANRQAFFLLVLPGLVTVLGLAVVLGKMYPRYLFSLAGFAILIVVRGAMVLGALLSRLAGSPYRIAIGRAIGITCIALVITVSAASLARVYRLPKQDFTGAMRWWIPPGRSPTWFSRQARQPGPSSTTTCVTGPSSWTSSRLHLLARGVASG